MFLDVYVIFVQFKFECLCSLYFNMLVRFVRLKYVIIVILDK